MGRAKKKYRQLRKKQREAAKPKDLTKPFVRKVREINKRFVDKRGYIRHEDKIIKDNSKGIDPVGIYPVCRDNGQGGHGR